MPAIICPHCAAPLSIPDGKGRLFRCPKCKGAVAVPEAVAPHASGIVADDSPTIPIQTNKLPVKRTRRYLVAGLAGAALLSCCVGALCWFETVYTRMVATASKPAWTGSPTDFYGEFLRGDGPTRFSGQFVELQGVAIRVFQDQHRGDCLDVLEMAGGPNARPQARVYNDIADYSNDLSAAALAPPAPVIIGELDAVESVRAKGCAGKVVNVRGWCAGRDVDGTVVLRNCLIAP